MNKCTLAKLLSLVLMISLIASLSAVVFAAEGKSGPAVDKDTVVIATADETPSMTTAGHNAVAGDYVNQLTHNGLFRLDNELNPVPDLVEDYKVEKDDKGEETIWTFTLHKGIKFSDGSDLTAEDVVASLEYAKTLPDNLSYTGQYATIEALDDLNIRMTTDGPSAAMLYNLAHHSNFINPRKLLEQKDYDFNANPVGAGPYKLVDWKRSEQLTFAANEYYFDEERAPKIKNIIWKIIPSGVNRTIALQAGEVDYIIEFDSSTYDQVKEDANVVIWDKLGTSHNWLCLNNRVEPFDDINVRKAINAAINKQDIVDVAMNGHAEPVDTQTPLAMLGSTEDNSEGYDMEKAQEYLTAWGGDPASIKLEMICSNDTKRRAAEVIQSNLLDLGINAEIVSMDLATYLSETAAGNFTGFIGGYTSNEMMSFLNGVFHSKNVNSSNKTGLQDPKVDEMIEKAMATVDQEERGKILEECTAYLNTLCPEIALWQENCLSAYKADLQDVFVSAGGSFRPQEWSWK